MPTLHVELFAGRTVEQKRALAQALTEATVRTLGGSPGNVGIVFVDVQRHDWARGGTLCSEALQTAATAAPAPAPTAASNPAAEGGRFSGSLGPNMGGTPD